MNFVTVDVETANPDLASICQIGIVDFEAGSAKQVWQSTVNPEDYFDDNNVVIHGITEEAVKRAPTFPEIHAAVTERLDGKIIVSHTSFDRVAIAKVTEKYGLRQVQGKWLDSAKVVRRAWPELSHRGYGLKNVAQKLGIAFRHHEAQEDARAAGEILVRAIQETRLTVDEWLDRVRRPIEVARSSSGSSRIQPSPTCSRIGMEGNPEGSLHGEVVAFTGALSIPRRRAAELAAAGGCKVTASVNKATTLLVVGDQDIRKLAGHEKSSKQRKAEELIGKGQAIRILGEGDFERLVGLTP